MHRFLVRRCGRRTARWFAVLLLVSSLRLVWLLRSGGQETLTSDVNCDHNSVRKLGSLRPRFECRVNQSWHDHQCIFHDVCLTERGLLFPLVGPDWSGRWDVALRNSNLASVGEEYIVWFSPQLWTPNSSQLDLEVPYSSNVPLVVVSPFSSQHLSHWLVNSVLPAFGVACQYTLHDDSTPGEWDLLLAGVKARSFEDVPWLRPDPPGHPDIDGFLGNRNRYVMGIRRLRDLTVGAVYGVWRSGAVPITDRSDGFVCCYSAVVLGSADTCESPRTCTRKAGPLLLDSFAVLARNWFGVSPKRSAERSSKSPLTALIIQRRGSSRRFLNLEVAERVFRELRVSYQISYLENATLHDQVHMFYASDIVLAAHGNSLVNCLWMRNGTVIVEYLAHGWNNEWHWHIFRMRGLLHLPIESELLPSEAELRPKFRNVVIAEKALRAALVQSVNHLKSVRR